jgi:hypothetical protein
MKKIFLSIATLTLVAACSKESTNNNNTSSTYSFTRNNATSVSYSGQTERQEMLSEIGNYMKLANSLGHEISADTLVAMYKNEFGFTGVYSKNLFSKTFANDQQFFIDEMTAMAEASKATTNAVPGTAGVLNEEYPQAGTAESAGYLVNANGLEYRQLIIKRLMGAVFFHQAMEVYFGEDYMNDHGSDNQTVEAGKNYTAMEHHFDEAFGYAGIPIDLSADYTSKDNPALGFWGEYIVDRSNDNSTFGIPGLNGELIAEFIKGRKAIVDQKYAERNVAINNIAILWEKTILYTAGNYFKRSITEANIYKKHHYLSEGIGFLLASQYHFQNGTSVAPKIFDDSKISQALDIIGLNTNLYNVTEADLNQVISLITNAEPQTQS